MEKITCVVCGTQVERSEISQYSAYGGLPSPCCKICFQVNDYSINSIEELTAKSLQRRYEMIQEAK